MHLSGIISDHLARGERGALAVVVGKIGSAPRDEGAGMFVTANGKTFGTIGGGPVEAKAYLEAMNVIETGHCRMFRFGMDGKNASENDMICGGTVSIFIEPVDERQKEVYNAISNAIKRSGRGFVVARYSESGYSKSFISDTGIVTGDALDEEIKSRIHKAGERLLVLDGLIAMPVLARSSLYIFGAGHISQHISRIASTVGFDVTVIDDREDYSNTDRFTEARETIVGDFGDVFDRIYFSGSEYIVIVTRGHKHDALVLEQALKKPAKYIGMIGSRRKTATVFGQLKDKGFDDVFLSKVFAPIGLDIGAETPEEIAVSIVAELIQVRSNPTTAQIPLSRWKKSSEKSQSHSPDHHKILFG